MVSMQTPSCMQLQSVNSVLVKYLLSGPACQCPVAPHTVACGCRLQGFQDCTSRERGIVVAVLAQL